MLIEQINEAKPTWDFIGFFDDDFSHARYIQPEQQLGGMDALNNWPEDIGLVLAIGNPVVKRKILGRLTNTRVTHPVLIHPGVIMGRRNVAIGAGTIICAGNILTIDIVIGLRDGLDAEKSDNPAYVQQLESLYVYMTNRLMEANQQNDAEIIDEVARLMITVKEGWDAIGAPQGAAE